MSVMKNLHSTYYYCAAKTVLPLWRSERKFVNMCVPICLTYAV